MSEKERRILETFALIIGKLPETDKSYLLGLGEGMAIKVGQCENGACQNVHDGLSG